MEARRGGRERSVSVPDILPIRQMVDQWPVRQMVDQWPVRAAAGGRDA
jgi:hypothetical protein